MDLDFWIVLEGKKTHNRRNMVHTWNMAPFHATLITILRILSPNHSQALHISDPFHLRLVSQRLF